MYECEPNGQLTLLSPERSGNTAKPAKRRPAKQGSELIAIPYFHLDLSSESVDLFGQRHWELWSPWREGKPALNTGAAPRLLIRASLSDILETAPEAKYYLSKAACIGILRRAAERGKELPEELQASLMLQADLTAERYTVSEPKAYHINQRNEGIDLCGVSGALMATSNMQMQTFIAFAQNQRDEVRDLHNMAGALAAQPGMKQQTFVASFSAGAGASTGTSGYSEDVTPTLKGSASGNCMPSVLHVDAPVIYEHHGMDARVKEFGDQSPTVTARFGTGGGNTPLVHEANEVYCIVGNVIDRQPENGGNGIGYQTGLAYTLTSADRHAVFARQRVDAFRDDDIASTQSARQSKDATDLIIEPGHQYAQLIRRLTPLECERLQGFPDDWTNIPGASDSARYRALGNSVAIPCVEFIMKSLREVTELETERSQVQ